MALHIRSFQIRTDDATVFADLQLAREEEALRIRVRITRRKKTGEKFLGFARVNTAGELTHRPEEVTDRERDAIERALREAVS